MKRLVIFALIFFCLIYANISDAKTILPLDNTISGYIIEFKDEPVLAVKKNLDDSVKSLEKKIEEATPIIGAISNIFRRASISSAKSKIKKLSEYRDEIRKKHSEIIADARKKLGRTTAKAGEMNLEIINEFTDLFNGVSLNISEEEAEELKKLDGVKEIYPDYKARAMIIDSVPLIGADRVWQLDKDGNNCILSGKECLTGKGIIISVIDTGVDYTHQDLGGCLGENCKVVGGYDFINNDNNPMDDEGHGTHVAATAAGNGILKGVAPDAKIVAFKVLDSSGRAGLEMNNEGMDNFIFKPMLSPEKKGVFEKILDFIKKIFNI